jgi:hypothetical protein
VTGVAWHEAKTGADHGAVRRWAPTYPGTTVVRHRPEPLWRRWHQPRPAWTDRLITAALGVLTLLGGALAAGAMA